MAPDAAMTPAGTEALLDMTVSCLAMHADLMARKASSWLQAPLTAVPCQSGDCSSSLATSWALLRQCCAC